MVGSMELGKTLRRTLKAVAGFLTQQVVLQLLTQLPLAYFLTLVVEWWQGTSILLFPVSPVFWPILAFLSLCVLIPHAFVIPFIEWRNRPSKLRRDVDKAHLWATYAHRPSTTPMLFGYSHAQICQIAEDLVRELATKIPNEFREELPFVHFDAVDERSVAAWYEFISEIRPLIK